MRQHHSRRALSLGLALLAAPLPFAALAAEPIRIGMSGPFTGGSGPMGISMRDGSRLAVNEINAKGGVLGRPLELGGARRRGEERARRGGSAGADRPGEGRGQRRHHQHRRRTRQRPLLPGGADPADYARPSGSNLTAQFAPPNTDASYIFRVSLRDKIQVDMIVEEIIRRKLDKPAILADSTNYGQLGRDDLVAALKLKNITPVTVEKFNVKDVDMTSQLLRAKDSGANAILTYGVGPELAQIANGMAKLGWKVPIIGSWTLSMPNFIENAGANGEGARMPQTIILSNPDARKKAFIDGFNKISGLSRIPGPVWAAQGYDTVYILAAAITQAKSTAGPKIQQALENLDTKVDGLIMTYDKPFSATDHEAFKDTSVAVIGEVQGGGVVAASEARKPTN